MKEHPGGSDAVARPRACIAKARSAGEKLGRPKGSLGLPRLDGKGHEIRQFLRFRVSKNAIAWITSVSRPTLVYFNNSGCLQPAQRAFTDESGQHSGRGDACVGSTWRYGCARVSATEKRHGDLQGILQHEGKANQHGHADHSFEIDETHRHGRMRTSQTQLKNARQERSGASCQGRRGRFSRPARYQPGRLWSVVALPPCGGRAICTGCTWSSAALTAWRGRLLPAMVAVPGTAQYHPARHP